MPQGRLHRRTRLLQRRQMRDITHPDREFHQMQHGVPASRMAGFEAPHGVCASGQDTLTHTARIANSAPMHILPRRALLASLVTLLAACGRWERADRPAQAIEPLRYDHLTKLRLNVAVVDVEERLPPPGRDDVSAHAPYPPLGAVRQMAQDRLLAMGGAGRAVLSIRRAALLQSRGGYDGDIDVELALYGPDGVRLAFAEARASRRQGSDGPQRQTLHDMTRELMVALNVELEFQARRNLRDWLLADDAQATPGAAVPAPVQQEELAPPRR